MVFAMVTTRDTGDPGNFCSITVINCVMPMKLHKLHNYHNVGIQGNFLITCLGETEMSVGIDRFVVDMKELLAISGRPLSWLCIHFSM